MTDPNNESPMLSADVWEVIAKIGKQEGFTCYSVQSAAGLDHNAGFQGVLARIVLKGSRNINGILTQHQLSLICKMPPADIVFRKMFFSKILFEREIYVYEKLLPAFVSFQEEKGISTEEGFFEFPKCYGTFSDETNGDYALVMSDLKVDGFEMWNKANTLDFNHAKIALNALGRYHGISFGMRDQRAELFEEFKKLKPDHMLTMLDNEMTRGFWEQNFDMAMGTLEDHETNLAKNMKHLKGNYMKIMRKYAIDDAAEPFAVISHGDFWNNNMMYRYAAGSRVPEEAFLIDWQMTQYSSPAMDLSFFFYSSTEQSLRDEHYDDLLHVYYESCAAMIGRLGSDSEKLFKYTDLLDQMKRFAVHGLIMAPLSTQIATIDPNAMPDVDEFARQMAENSDAEFQPFSGSNPWYRKRMSNVIRDFFGRNYNL